MSDLARLPDCPTCGQPRIIPRRCTCGHPAVSHELRNQGERSFCLVADETGVRCGCKRYEEANDG